MTEVRLKDIFMSTNHIKLNTSLVEPLAQLEKLIIDNIQIILTPPPIYGSVDLRNAGFKLTPIDMNLFPAGFNNLNPDFMPLAINAMKEVFQQQHPNIKNILVIPESHTRNLLYWSNVRVLQDILEHAGYNTRLGFLSAELTIPQDINLTAGVKVTIEPLRRHGAQLFVDGFLPDIILLNNDLSQSMPEILQNLSQPIVPPMELGWSQRLKSKHFQYYTTIANEFANLIGIDKWIIAPEYRFCNKVDFTKQSGMECIIANAELLLAGIQKKYAEYQIPYQPYLVIKADAGTYGMAVMMARNIDELRSMNRKQRTRMSTTKGGMPVRRVIIQEGVYSFETAGEDKVVAEPVIYLCGQRVIGGFYRVHKNRMIDENLNSPGMHFIPLTYNHSSNQLCETRYIVYSVIAKLSMLAAAREIKDLR